MHTWWSAAWNLYASGRSDQSPGRRRSPIWSGVPNVYRVLTRLPLFASVLVFLSKYFPCLAVKWWSVSVRSLSILVAAIWIKVYRKLMSLDFSYKAKCHWPSERRKIGVGIGPFPRNWETSRDFSLTQLHSINKGSCRGKKTEGVLSCGHKKPDWPFGQSSWITCIVLLYICCWIS